MSTKSIIKFSLIGLCLVAVSGCDAVRDMREDAKIRPYEASEFFEDGKSARDLIEDTVARGHLELDDLLYKGRVDGELATIFPFKVTRDLILRGQERYQIFCSVCHDGLGYGQGMVVRRGFKEPQSFHTDRLRNQPVGYYFDVITNGFGVMSDYRMQIKAEDRWAIGAYVRALQLSQNAGVKDVPPEFRYKLDEVNEDSRVKESH